MVNNTYHYNGKAYPIGGIINGDIDNMTLTGGNTAMIYELEADGGYKIALSDKYGLMVETDNKLAMAICVAKIMVGQSIYVHSSTPQDFRKVLSVTEREGKHINIPRDIFVLNNVYVTRNFRQNNYNIEDERTRKETCLSRSKDKKVYKIKLCCNRQEERFDYWCEAKGKYLIQPECWNCDLYRKK